MVKLLVFRFSSISSNFSYCSIHVRGEWFCWTELHCFYMGSELSHWFVLVCVCVCVCVCSSRTWAINIYAVWQGERKTSGVTETGWKSTGHKPWSLKTSTHTHTHTHTHTLSDVWTACKTTGGMSESLTTSKLLQKCEFSSHLGINPHTRPRREFILHHGPNNLSTRLAPSNWLTGFRNKLPGLSALRLSQRVRGASESCTDFNKASRTLTRQATPSACDRPTARHPLDPLWFQALFILAQCNFRLLHKSPSEQHLPMFIKGIFQVKYVKST